MFFFARIPEVAKTNARRGSAASEHALEIAVDANGNEIGAGPIYKQWNLVAGFGAQFCYVGAQGKPPSSTKPLSRPLSLLISLFQ